MAQTAYKPPVSRLLCLGEPQENERHHDPGRWRDYGALGLSAFHGADLLAMATDGRFFNMDGARDEVWGSLHAWRALGQLSPRVEIVDPLLKLLDRASRRNDDWALEDLPGVLGLVGPDAVRQLLMAMRDQRRELWTRIAVLRSLELIASGWAETRDEIVAALRQQLALSRFNEPGLNGFVVHALIETNGVEAIPEIEKAFARGDVDTLIVGDVDEALEEIHRTREERAERMPASIPPEELFDPENLVKWEDVAPAPAAEQHAPR